MDRPLLILPALALALYLALWAGRRAQAGGIPRVTAYLVVGVVLGPHVLGQFVAEDGAWQALLLNAPARELLVELKVLALGFILFRVGAEFRLADLRRTGPRVLVVSVCEVMTTAALVFAAVLALTRELPLALVAMALATSSAPSATLLTLREVEAEGPVSRSLIQLVGLDNLATLLAFPILFALAFGVGEPGRAVGGSLVALAGGAGLGAVAAVTLEALGAPKERAVLGLLLVLACIGLGHGLGANPTGGAMLACFGAGVAVTNGSPHSERLGQALEAGVYPLYVLFFLGAGSELHLESLGHLGVLGVAFIVARTTGKVLGARLGLRLAGWREMFPGLGNGLLCQAGVALGLVHVMEQSGVAGTKGLQNVALGSVVFFEFLGPLLTRRTAVKAGEVKLANLLLMSPVGASAWREVGSELGRNLGLRDYGKLRRSGGLTVRHVMRRASEAAPANLEFDRVLKLLGETGSDLLPVVDAEQRLVGVISFDDVKDILYDPHLRSLVIAEDLAQPVDEPMEPELALDDALARMDARGAHSWPVVEDGRLAGILKRKDCYSTLHKAFARGPAAAAEEEPTT